MIILPKGAFIVERKEVEKKSVIIGVEEKKLNVGTIVFTHEDLNIYQGCEVVFRESFGEEIEMLGHKLLYFRDFDLSIYYVTKD